MNWGEELWDQYSQLEKHTEKGIDFLDKYCHFVKERQQIELQYATSLKRLIKSSQPKEKKNDDVPFSTVTSFKNILKELQGIANQHDLIADGLATKVTKEVQTVIADLKQERKKLLQDARSKEAAKDKSIKKMEQTKDTYRAAHGNYISAKQQFEKVDSDLSQSRAQVEKSRQNMISKDQSREESKNEYILQLTQTNKDQHEHYYTILPDVFNKIQEMDERRITKTSELYKQYADCHRSVLPIVSKCLDDITMEAEKISPAEDSKKVTTKYKSGLVPPDDFRMLDLDEPRDATETKEPDSVSGNSITSNNSGGTVTGKNKKTKKGGLRSIWAKDDERGGSIRRLKIPHTPSFRRKPEPAEDFSHLQPHQQRRELQKKIDEVQVQVDQEIKSKEALIKMREVYTKNPTLGDPASVESQLTSIGKKVDTLRLELQKYQKYMGYSAYSNKTNNSESSDSNYKDKAEGKTGTPVSTPPSSQPSSQHSTPVSDRYSSVKQEAASDDPLHGSNQSSPVRAPVPPMPHNDNAELEDTDALTPGGDSLTSPVSSRQESFYEDVDDDFEDHPQAKAKFAFQSGDVNSLSMEVGDVLDIMEEDTGDGWTRVRKGDNEGFVPTTYLEFDS
ncbi:formin-binding protein 1-like [Asterias amurensis]|uniref:formin-binding protein 1-like n=1 Tax=Asterias amurensis TaxID=7602 RepID=UPI003AB6B1C9